MTRKKFSFVVPVYNVEGYLPECIDSLLNQNYYPIEIILVDDGSTDASPEICDQYAQAHTELIRVIHKPNGGLSDARNTGIRNASGDYILFVDSDDYIAPGFLSNMTSGDIDLSVDVIFLEITKIFPDGYKQTLGNGYKRDRIYCKTQTEVMNHLAALPKFPASACDKMVKRSLFDTHQLMFMQGLLSEDMDWSIRLFLAARSYDYYSGEYYFYRQLRTDSITKTVSEKTLHDWFYMMEKWSNICPEKAGNPEAARAINSFWAYEYCLILSNLRAYDRNGCGFVRNKLKEFRWLLQYGRSRRSRAVYKITRVVGIHLTSLLLNFYRKVTKHRV